jgi:hypothetical protein
MKLVSPVSQIMHIPCSAPALSAGITLRWHALLSFMGCMLLCQCTRSKKPASESAWPEWFFASDNPPTYCPKGYSLPKPGSLEAARAEYIQMLDRSTRYYIPEGCATHRQLALQLSRNPRGGHSAAEAVQGSAECLAESIFSVVSAPFFVIDWFVKKRLDEKREVRNKNEARDATTSR